jgi:hypothetical protein
MSTSTTVKEVETGDTIAHKAMTCNLLLNFRPFPLLGREMEKASELRGFHLGTGSAGLIGDGVLRLLQAHAFSRVESVLTVAEFCDDKGMPVDSVALYILARGVVAVSFCSDESRFGIRFYRAGYVTDAQVAFVARSTLAAIEAL